MFPIFLLEPDLDLSNFSLWLFVFSVLLLSLRSPTVARPGLVEILFFCVDRFPCCSSP
jgi:hypothetical protein